MAGHASPSGDKPASTPSDAQQSNGVDLARLSGAEREVLLLLAEGHTAKSMATLTGRSVAAINERLREARRKTGATSSRELARLLKAQKACDEEMGVASVAAPASSQDIEGAITPSIGTRRIGAIVMATLVIAGIALTTLLSQGTPHGSVGTTAKTQATNAEANSGVLVDDPLLGRLPSLENHPGLLYSRVRSEPRDPIWAARAETALKAHYERLSGTGRVEDLRILCASTICEVAGAIVGKNVDEINATGRVLQNGKLNATLIPTGLKFASGSFGSRPNSDQSVFAIYWLRATPESGLRQN